MRGLVIWNTYAHPLVIKRLGIVDLCLADSNSFLLLNFCFLEPIHIDNSSEIQKVTSVLNFFHNFLETSQSAEHLQKWVSTSNGSAVTYMSAKPYAAASIGIRGFRMLAIFFILIAKLRIVVGYSKFAVYILAFCFSLAPEPRYFEQ